MLPHDVTGRNGVKTPLPDKIVIREEKLDEEEDINKMNKPQEQVEQPAEPVTEQ